MTSSHYPQPRLLLAEEDATTRAFLEDNLTADGYAVDVAGDRNETLSPHHPATTTTCAQRRGRAHRPAHPDGHRG